MNLVLARVAVDEQVDAEHARAVVERLALEGGEDGRAERWVDEEEKHLRVASGDGTAKASWERRGLEAKQGDAEKRGEAMGGYGEVRMKCERLSGASAEGSDVARRT